MAHPNGSRDRMIVPSSMISVQTDTRIPPGAAAVLWALADYLDEIRLPSHLDEPSIWVSVPARRLRGLTRDDNWYLRRWLDRLRGTSIGGTFTDPKTGTQTDWASVLIAGVRRTDGGATIELHLPAEAVYALRAPTTYAQIETGALWQLPGHARALYMLLADRRRQTQRWWVYDVEELRGLLNLGSHRSFDRWTHLRTRVLEPAIATINRLCPVEITMTPIRTGRRIAQVKFDWQWKSISAAAATEIEQDRHTIAQGRVQVAADAPPLVAARAETWQAIRHQIAAVHGREARSWLQDIAIAGTEDTIVLHAPSPASADFVQRTYGALISRLWKRFDPAATVSIEAGP